MLDALTNASKSNSLLANPSQANKDNQDLFLQILSMELSNQNPLSPMDNDKWVSQLAQFQSLNETASLNKQMKDLNSKLAFMEAVNLVGKKVTYLDENDGTVSGVVASISQKDGEVFAMIGQQKIALDKITSVMENEL